MPVFKSPQVLDAATGRPRPELIGQPITVVEPGTTTPVPVTEYSTGTPIPGSVLTVGPLYNLTPFVTPAGVYEVEVLAADGTRSFLETAEGARIAAEAAEVNAATSASAAAGSQTAAEVAASNAAALAVGVVRSVNGTAPDSSGNVNVAGGGPGGGVTDHGALSGLADDDHPQYLTNGRGDARYYTKAEVDAATSSAATASSAADRARGNHTGTQAIGTVTGLQAALEGKAPTSHTHDASALTGGTVAPARLGTGATGGSTRYLREDGTWSVPAGGSGGGVASVAGVGPDGEGDVPLTKAHIGLGNVNNTTDAAKPISTATQTALNTKLTSPGAGAANRLVGLDAAGAAVAVPRGAELGANLVVQRDGNGQVAVPETPTATNHGTSKGYVDTQVGSKADDSTVVKTTGAQTVAGVKTFSSAPVVPDAAFSQAKVAGLPAALAGKVGSSTVSTIWTGSQAAYDAIGSKDAATLYLVTG